MDCDDGNPCTEDICDVNTGICILHDITLCCVTNADCDDGDPCSYDECDNVMRCKHRPAACPTNTLCRADTSCIYSGLFLERGEHDPENVVLTPESSAPVLQLKLTTEAIGGILNKLRLTLMGLNQAAIKPYTLSASLFTDEEGYANVNLTQKPLAEATKTNLETGEVIFTNIGYELKPASEHRLVVALKLVETSTSAGGFIFPFNNIRAGLWILVIAALSSILIVRRWDIVRTALIGCMLIISLGVVMACTYTMLNMSPYVMIGIKHNSDVQVETPSNKVLMVQGAPIYSHIFKIEM